MNINIKNLNEIYNYNFHDANRIKFEYSFEEEIAKIEFIAPDTEINRISFIRVICVELNLSKPWISGGNIVGVYLSKNIDEIHKLATKLSHLDSDNNLIAYSQEINDYFITRVDLNSGDNIIVLAKELRLEKLN
jgi:hypothetical protein